MKKIIFILLLILFCSGIGKGVYWAKNGFSLRRIASPVGVELHRWSNEADAAFMQTFRYLGRGRQCFAFESLDGKYVLKFPRTDIYQIPFRMRVNPFFSLEKSAFALARRAREKFVSESMRIAFDELKEETGILAIHFGKEEGKKIKVNLIDAVGCPYLISLYKTSFVLQLKKPLLMKCFLEALSTGDISKKEKILSALIDVVIMRGKKGIWNQDESFLRNYGFDGEKGYQIDIGSFYLKGGGVASIRDTMHPIRTWLLKNDPSILPYFERTLEEKIKRSYAGSL